MGKTKTMIIDDSLPQEEVKKLSKKSERKDDLVEKLKRELGIEEPKSKPTDSNVILEGAQRPIESNKEDAIASLQHDKKEKKIVKPGKEKPRSKKYQEIAKDLDKSKTYPLAEAVDLVKKLNYAKFDATLEAHINTTTLGIRGLVSLPFASGKKLVILAFGKSAGTSGTDIVGSDEIIEEINKGKVSFDLLITTPEWMPKLAKIARILGPRGLMPNPKSGTITEDLKKAVESFQSGKTEYKTEAKAPVIHLGLGKLTQPTEELSANIKALLQVLGKSRVKKVSLSPTMGPSVKLDLSSI